MDIRGTFNRNGETPLIFQRSHGKLQKKAGPIIQHNPRTRMQQLNRLFFRAALDNADSMTDEQKELYRELNKSRRTSSTWRLRAIQEFMKANAFNAIRFDESLFCGGRPLRNVFRLNEITFDDAFLSTEETLPLNKTAIQAKYPNIDISSLFPEGE
jgi:hypothetical protein